eukprot:CAMPEP_0174335286 /NCGR_PEP_ID=MMETSP0810-20121108/20653_1 /TAXON_ID=73025 ORGANISM="Eutreptiella gymnastica-like, Strain CCMP1594" /NCGR_SAMPLE_ID=MMETSP0810 /ASSEMBLY_ACC=CAM_ASM_000659 /LENGTH=250 /DNA_ID=CAMNT_0015453557 /DNA_START=24 /DNA_END=774 /DNA_ORIENTATION=-
MAPHGTLPHATWGMSTYCLCVLDCHLRGLPLPPVPEGIPDFSCRIFVSYHNHSKHNTLRGCIGCVTSSPLCGLLQEYAVRAAQDSRFPSISLHELPALTCEVNVLSPNEPIDHCYDWESGVHGLVLEFTAPDSDASYSAEYLPCVAAETGWGKEYIVESLIQKAGYDGPITPELLQSLKCWRYKSTVVSSTYQDYLQVYAPPLPDPDEPPATACPATAAAAIDMAPTSAPPMATCPHPTPGGGPTIGEAA